MYEHGMKVNLENCAKLTSSTCTLLKNSNSVAMENSCSEVHTPLFEGLIIFLLSLKAD